MTKHYFHGPQTGANIGTLSVTADGVTATSDPITSFRLPLPQTVRPTIADAFTTGTLTPDDNGITVTTRIWRNADTLAVLGNGATLSATGLGGVWVEYSPDNGTTWSPAIRVHETGMMASHDADDAAVLTIVPHGDMTHIAVTNGAWSDPATWLGGRVPGYGAVVLIARGTAVEYDETRANIRLDRIRVDGRFWVDTANATTEQFKLLVETVVVTRGGDFEIGTAANRLPDTASFELTISGKDYSATSYTATDMKASRFSAARGWERGVIFMGRGSMWGAQKLTWAKTDPMDAGATSATFHKVPTGLAVGDTIVIGGTDCSYSTPNPIWQDEECVVTGISGNIVSWDTPLVNPHKNQLVSSTRTDLYPAVIVKGNKNITFRSEVADDNARRGHLVWMHHYCTVDAWDFQCIDMGRTDKSVRAGVINTGGDFARAGGIGNNPAVDSLDNRDNLQSRYPVHLHHVGFSHAGARPIVDNCYVGGTPGWGIVHHACDADFQDCAAYKFGGCGMVSESANEVGAWIDCIAMQATVVSSRLNLAPKTAEQYHTQGDTFRLGYGFGYRGRAMRVSRCVAVSTYCGHGFFHRQEGVLSQVIAQTVNPKRSYVDLKEAGAFALYDEYHLGEWELNDYPIIHFADCESIASFWSFAVTKAVPRQSHDVNIRLKRYKSWGYYYRGAEIEYVGTYLLDNWDMVSGQNRHWGNTAITFGQNAHQILLRNTHIEGSNKGIEALRFSNIAYSDDNADDPRWGYVGADFLNVGTPVTVVNSNPPDTYANVFHQDADLDGTAINYTADPSETYPLVIGTINASDLYSWRAANGDGGKIDNLSNNARILPKGWDLPFRNGEFQLQRMGRYQGFYQYNGKDVYVLKDIISDRVTARPFKMTKLFEAPLGTFWDGNGLDIDNGPLIYGANPVSVSDVSAVVAKNGSVTINIPAASGASGGDGSTYTLDTDDYIAPDHGRATLDAATGDLTFTPDRNFTGMDEMYVFVESGHRFGTVRVSFLMTESGSDAGITTPVVDTHFTASDSATANTIDVQLLAPPNTSERRIELVQYSTDGGTTWRRLCFGWVQAIHKVSVESNGTAIAPGSYNVRIRYKTDYDLATSTASGDDAVTVV